MLIENITAILFLAASLLSILCLSRINKIEEKKACVFTLILGSIAFLDELSFGERIFDLSMPYLGSQKIDSIHDLFKKVYTITTIVFNYIPGYISVLIISAFMISLFVLCLKSRARLTKYLSDLGQSKHGFFLILCVSQLCVATVVDFDIVYNNYLFLFEELLELNAGLALVLSSIIIGRKYFLSKKSDVEAKKVPTYDHEEAESRTEVFNNKLLKKVL